jgi:hypothetical protein
VDEIAALPVAQLADDKAHLHQNRRDPAVASRTRPGARGRRSNHSCSRSSDWWSFRLAVRRRQPGVVRVGVVYDMRARRPERGRLARGTLDANLVATPRPEWDHVGEVTRVAQSVRKADVYHVNLPRDTSKEEVQALADQLYVGEWEDIDGDPVNLLNDPEEYEVLVEDVDGEGGRRRPAWRLHIVLDCLPGGRAWPGGDVEGTLPAQHQPGLAGGAAGAGTVRRSCR